MKEKPLSFDEAAALCEEYSELVGQPFCGEYRALGNIVAVAISPYSKLDKYYFLEQFKLHRTASAALASYAGNEFDVVLIGYTPDGQPLGRELTAHLAYIAGHPDILIDLD